MRAQGVAHAAQVGEQEALRKGEVLLQQPIAREAAQVHRQQGLIVLKAHRLHDATGQRGMRRAAGAERAHQGGYRATQHALVELVGDLVVAAEVHAQILQRQLAELRATRRAQLDAQPALDLAAQAAERRQGQVGGVGKIFDAGDLDRPHRHVVPGAELARRGVTLGQLAAEQAAARHLDAACQVAVAQIGLQLRDQHRRRGRQKLRVDDLEQALREARELGVELELHPAGQEGRALEQSLDVGVVHLDAVDAQPRGDLRELLRELGTHLAQVLQFLVVVAQQSRVHGEREVKQ